MSQALLAIQSARTHLNDINGLTWSDAILLPFLQVAHGEMVQELDVNGAGVLKYQSSPITVTAGSLNLGANQPSNILEPISMQERDPGTDAESFTDMFKVDFLPEVDQSQYLTWWSWNGEIISFTGATLDREVIIRYKGSLTTPQLLTDPIGVIYGELYLGPRIAELAYDSIGKNSKKLSDLAKSNLNTLVQRSTLANQTPVRRKGYRTPKSTLGVTGPVAITIPMSSTSSSTGGYLLSSTTPNGVLTAFTFLYNPKAIFVNGALQPTSSYTVSPVGSLFIVTFTVAFPAGTVIVEAY